MFDAAGEGRAATGRRPRPLSVQAPRHTLALPLPVESERVVRSPRSERPKSRNATRVVSGSQMRCKTSSSHSYCRCLGRGPTAYPGRRRPREGGPGLTKIRRRSDQAWASGRHWRRARAEARASLCCTYTICFLDQLRDDARGAPVTYWYAGKTLECEVHKLKPVCRTPPEPRTGAT